MLFLYRIYPKSIIVCTKMHTTQGHSISPKIWRVNGYTTQKMEEGVINTNGNWELFFFFLSAFRLFVCNDSSNKLVFLLQQLLQIPQLRYLTFIKYGE